MTYCLAIKLDEGLVFCSDSRTNSGADQVSAYSKLHRFSVGGDRQLFILTAGNLATTQAVVEQIERDIKADTEFNFCKAEHISDVADYIGRLSLEQQKKFVTADSPNAGFRPAASFIIGGQIKGSSPDLYLIYPEGNHIRTSDQHPFLQIGETKYGKPILDRIIRKDTPHEVAMRCALVSMDSTMRSNATVGPPIELVFYAANSLKDPAKYYKFDENDPYWMLIRKSWDEKIVESFSELPMLEESHVAQ